MLIACCAQDVSGDGEGGWSKEGMDLQCLFDDVVKC